MYYLGIYNISPLSTKSQGDTHIGIEMINESGKINSN